MADIDPIQPSDAELLELSKAGDSVAFRHLVDRFHGQLLATATGMLGPGTEAEEVVQETLIRFHRALQRFEGRSTLGTYLTRITMNEALKVINRRNRWYSRFLSRDDPDRPTVDPVEELGMCSLEQNERIDCIREAVQALKPEFRSVVVLRFLNDYSTEECANVLGIPPGTVMSRLSRALDKLGPTLKGLHENG